MLGPRNSNGTRPRNDGAPQGGAGQAAGRDGRDDRRRSLPADGRVARRVPGAHWYSDAKLGIFIHYGIFSVPGFPGVGCWYGHCMYNPADSAFKFHQMTYGPLDKFGYKDLPQLTASRFNADEWVPLAKESGSRFIVPVSCFHDGFAMWDSKLTDWNAVKVGPKRDYDGLLAAAARRQGLKFGVAWHHFRIPMFFGTGRRPGTDIHPPYSGTPWSCYGPDSRPANSSTIDWAGSSNWLTAISPTWCGSTTARATFPRPICDALPPSISIARPNGRRAWPSMTSTNTTSLRTPSCSTSSAARPAGCAESFGRPTPR